VDIDPVLVSLLVSSLVLGLVRGKDNFKLDSQDDDRDKDFTGIRCPACKWRPTRSDTWACSPGCGEVWNTFATRGECPGCQRHWSNTQCTKCGVWSDHDAWYEERPGQDRR
jgi:hypothetical protein